MRIIQLLILSFLLLSCKSTSSKLEISLQKAGTNRIELEKVIEHYKHSGDQLKLKAAYYLIENLPDQYHYEGKTIDQYSRLCLSIDSVISSGEELDFNHLKDSLKAQFDTIRETDLRKVNDIEAIKSDFMIDNIEDAFAAWNYPWARKLSFNQFCEYILPYKVKNEIPENWKKYFQIRYKRITDSLKDNTDAKEVCTLINNDLKKWFYFSDLSFPYDPSFTNLIKSRSGKCPEEAQIAAYAMRALGIPVSLDYVPMWANRTNRHDWNGFIVDDQKTIAFLGTEIDPGPYKIEFAMPGSLRSKRAKIFRYCFDEQQESLAKQVTDLEEIPSLFRSARYKDVTKQYIPTSSISLTFDERANDQENAYLCVFNNGKWKPISWAKVHHSKASFADMGKEIIYLPTVYEDGDCTPIGQPFILNAEGNINYLRPNFKKQVSVELGRKYPAGDDNKIVLGQTYELLYWDNSWKSVGKQIAKDKTLEWGNLPENTLFWIRDLDEGYQERIFTIKNNKPIWW